MMETASVILTFSPRDSEGIVDGRALAKMNNATIFALAPRSFLSLNTKQGANGWCLQRMFSIIT
jgi:hypothetical protein